MKLIAENAQEEIILAYIEKNASETLCKKIEDGNKTMKQCMAYIKSEAKKQASGGVAVIEDKEVFGWAMHFFEEDEIKVNELSEMVVEKKPAAVKTEPKKLEPKKDLAGKDGQLQGQLNIFDLLGG